MTAQDIEQVGEFPIGLSMLLAPLLAVTFILKVVIR